jgi:hypothetical protein
MINKWGVDMLVAMIQKYKEYINEKYIPVATTPLAFKNKIGDIKVAIDKIKNNPLVETINI